MKIDWKKLVVSLAIPLGVGALATLLSGNGMDAYAQLNRPPLSPPGWVFGVVWTILYLLMGYACFLIWTADIQQEEKARALKLYAAQLAVNYLWPLVFFGLQWRLAAFGILIVLWVLIYQTIRAFSEIDEKAANLLIPYILWVSFATYLNLGAYLLN